VSHAVVIHVKLPVESSEGEGMRMLNEQVIPNAKAQSGFQKGAWMQSADNTGLAVVVFDTAENADAAVPNLKPPPGGPEVISSAVYEVHAEA
jgi:hypothetical protein